MSKSTKILLAPLLLALMVLSDGCKSDEGVAVDWPTDLPQALAKAKAEKKLVLVNFTGSDWCPGCIEVHKNVFMTKEFQAYADKNLELVEVDFPERKKQSDELKKTNEALSKKYEVQGYPTLFLLNADGKVLNKDEGYDHSKPAAFIAALEKAGKKG